MTRSKKILLPSSMGILLCTLLACSSNNEQAGIEGTGDSFTASGTISTFGSIWVNGTRINTDSAAITFDDASAIESNLRKGMIVDVSGSVDQNGDYTAQSIQYRTTITGEITATSGIQNSIDRVLTINGQLIYVSEDIEFESITFDDLEAGLDVSVSAFVKDEHLIATYIKREDNTTNPVLTGFIDEVDDINRLINVNGTAISYADSTIGPKLNALTSSQWQGKKIRVVLANQAEEFAAINITLIPQPAALAGSHIAIEGIINSVVSSNLFKVGDFEVNLPENLLSTTDINLIRENQRVSIQGYSNDQGVLEVKDIQFIFSAPTRLKGPIQSIDTNERSIKLLENTIYFNLFTVYQDDGPNQQRRFNFEDLELSDQITVYAYQRNGKLYAKKVVRQEHDMQPLRIRGQIEQINQDQSLQILGYTVLTHDIAYPVMLSYLEVGKYIEVIGFLSAEQTITAEYLIPRKEPCSTLERPHCLDLPFPEDKDHDFEFDFDFDKEELDKEFPEDGLWSVDKSIDLKTDKEMDFKSSEESEQEFGAPFH